MFDYDPASNLVLIIDDNVEMIRFLSGIVKAEAQIIFATSGQGGIALARQRRPTLILLDLNLPDVDGYEICRQLKNEEDTKECPIIVVTAETSRDAEVDALNAGAVDFIIKPLNPAVALARVKTHLKLRQTVLELERLANHDGLTGLFNRRFFHAAMSQEFLRHQRQKLPLAIALVDIDHFKKFNDNYGHVEGDQCLATVAKLIELVTRRPGEIVARFGGEEFIVLLPYTTIVDAEKYGERLCDRVRNQNIAHHFQDGSQFVTVSVGVYSAIPNQDMTENVFVENADRALYQAKSAGRNCVRALMAI